uniref:Xylulose kinase-1 n=1 Tax=Tanacetum cinerariifolium TaxID=118510 RepID=A0A6L2MMP7_TANCI|nr:hypothetical protein [Tanacetum cinerariifolium]
MAPLTFADTHNMVAFLSKSDASEGFDQIMDFLNAHTIQYALVVNPTIYVSCIKQFWATATIKKVNDVVQLRALIDGKKVVVSEDVIRRDLYLDDADGVECFPNEEIFAELARMGYEKPPPKLTFYKAFFSTQWKFLIHTLIWCISAKRTAWNEFSCSMASAVICLATGVETPLFASMLVQPQPQAVEEEEVKMPIDPTPPSPTTAPSPPPQDPTPTPHATPYASPPQEQPTATSESSMSLLNTLMETCAILSPKVVELEQDKHIQALEILKLKKRVKKLEKKKRLKHSGLKRLRKVGTSQRVESSADIVVGAQEDASKQGGKIEAMDADKDITLVDVEKDEEVVTMDVEPQGRIDQEEVSTTTKDVIAAEPTVFDDEEENINWNAIAEQIQERHLDNIRKYQSLKKKPFSIAQARKNMIIYLKNMAGYKMEHFRGMTYDKVRPIFKREYKKVQTLFKPDKDVEEPKKKRVAEETLLQESFKKLKAIEVSASESTQETPSNDPKEMSKEDVHNMLEIIPVSEFKVEALQAYQSFEDMLKGFDREDLVALWSLVKEKFSSVVPSVDKQKALWVELKRLFKPDADDVLWKLQRHDMFMLTEKDYPLSNVVMTLMLSAKLQVEEDNEMARDLVMKIFMKANKPKSKSLDTSSK